MADSRVGIDGFAAAAARGFKYERLDYPRHLKRRVRFANPGQLSRLNTHSIHLLYRA